MSKTTLNDSEICQVIREYINEDIYQYAIMLDGEWGCGKSYFIKNKVKPMFDEGRECSEHKYVYVSLYGISSVEALSKAVTGAYFAAVAPYKEQFMEILSAFGAPLSEEIPYVGKTISEAIKQGAAVFKRKIVDLKMCFFVFDDLERCCMPVTEVLGYINRLIETNECKVLIVANERECGQSRDRSRELELMAASMLKEYMPEWKPDPAFEPVRDAQEPKNAEFLRLRRFGNELFRSDALYRKTKEKLIGKTLKYEPDLKRVLSIIVNKALRDEPHNLRVQLRDVCVNTMAAEQVTNLRILQYALSCYAAVNPIIKNLNIESELMIKVAVDVMNSILRVSIRARSSKKGKEWDIQWKDKQSAYQYVYCDDEEHIGWSYSDYMTYGFLSFRFVHEYVISGKLDCLAAERDLQAYAEGVRADIQEVTGAFANINKGFWNLTEEVLQENVTEVRRLFLENKYSPRICLKVLSMLVFFHCEFGIEYCACDDLKKHLVKEVRAGRIKYDFEYDSALRVETLEGRAKAKYKRYLEELRAAQKKANMSDFKDELDVFDSLNWSDELNNLIAKYSNIDEMVKKKGFICYLDIDRLTAALLSGYGRDYSNMISAMKSAYRFGLNDFVDDLEPLVKLVGNIRAAQIPDRLTARSRDAFCRHADGYIEAIKAVLDDEGS